MVNLISLNNQAASITNNTSFGKKEKKEIKENTLLADELKEHPIKTPVKIQADKLSKAFTTYPKLGLSGSKNANFYQFLTMGMVPYLTGSAAMIGVFNLAGKFFDTPSAVNSSKNLGKKMGIGVVLYGLGKTLSKKLIEKPVKWKYGIENTPYLKKVDNLPETNKEKTNNLVTYEYHKAYESVDFPYWDLFYDNKFYGEERNAYFNNVAKKMKIEDAEHSDQKVKDKIREKLVKVNVFSTVSSYFWAASGVAIGAQKPWETLVINPKTRANNFANHMKNAASQTGIGKKVKEAAKYDFFAKDFGKKFAQSCKEVVKKGSKPNIAGIALFGTAVGLTLLGNFKTLFDFNNKGADKAGASPLFDESKEKVVC